MHTTKTKCSAGARCGWIRRATLLLLGGCNSNPAAIEPIDVDPTKASGEAMRLYDANGDDALDDAELASVPGILRYKDKYDANQDGIVSRQEIADRIGGWSEKGVGFRTLDVTVLLDKRPLPGAIVRFVPEPYLGEAPKVGTAETDGAGHAKMSIAVEHIPEDLRTARMRGMFGGTYRIEVTHPGKSIPERYRNGTALGDEIARDTIGDRIVLNLSSK